MKKAFAFAKSLLTLLGILALELIGVIILSIIVDPEASTWPPFLLLLLWFCTIIAFPILKMRRKKVVGVQPLSSTSTTINKVNTPSNFKVKFGVETQFVDVTSRPDVKPEKKTTLNKDFIKVVLLERISRKSQIIPKDIGSYPYYLTESLGLVNPYFEYEKLINDGLIIQSPLSNSLLSLDKPTLVELCNELQMPAKGTKKDLVARIITSEQAEVSAVKYLGKTPYYEVSDEGIQFIQNNEDYLKLNSHYYLNKESYFALRNKWVNEGRQPVFEEIAYAITSQMIMEELDNDLHRAAMHSMKNLAELCWQMNRLDEGLYHYIFSIVLNLSCLGNNGYVKSSDYIVSSLNNMRKLSSFTEEKVIEIMDQLFKSMHLPYQKYSNGTLKIMLLEFYHTGTIDIEKYRKFEIKPKFVTDYGSFWKDRDDYEEDEDNYKED